VNILISPDKFKGTLSASEAANVMARGWAQSRPHDTLDLLPMSDGGDGFGEIIGGILGAERQTIEVIDAAHRPLKTEWWWHETSQTALVESAQVVGLAQLPRATFHPFLLDTQGLGLMLAESLRRGARRCLVGIGGSATNDAGFGMARALGWQFLDEQRHPIQGWTELHRLRSLEAPSDVPLFDELLVASDVQNPLLGPTGCTRIYGPQKGLDTNDFEPSEANLAQLARVVKKQMNHDFASEPGTGAAGGLGFGLRCFLNAHIQSGFDIFSRYADLPTRLKGADLVVTGEGSIDHSTAMGKGVGQLAKICRDHQVPCLGLAGISSHPEETGRIFTQVHSISPWFTTSEEAMRQPALWLERMTAQVAATFQPEGSTS